MEHVDEILKDNMYTLNAAVFPTTKQQPQEADFYRENKFLS